MTTSHGGCARLAFGAAFALGITASPAPARVLLDDADQASELCKEDDQVRAAKVLAQDPDADAPGYKSGTSMVSISSCWRADTSNNSYRVLNDLYAHWTIKRIDNSTATRDYDGEKRPALLRLFFGRNRSFVGLIKIDMRDPDQTFTIPLVNFGYQGKVGKGESWSTEVVSDDQSQPFFRIGPSTSAIIAVTARSANDVEVRASSAILSTLRSITTIVSPGGSLITSLNREPLKQASSAIDNALSSIWSQRIEERQVSGRQLSEWYERASFLIEIDVPNYVKSKPDGSGGPPKLIKRTYRLQLSCPRYSMFDAKPACESDETDLKMRPTQELGRPGYQSDAFLAAVAPLYRRVSTEQIINYPLAQGKTLAQFLSDHAWYTQFLRMGDASATESPEIAKPKTSADARVRTSNDYASLCSQIVDALYGAGLSAFDARLGLWAVISGSSDFVGISHNFREIPQCQRLLPGGEKGLWQYPEKPQKKS